MSSKKPIPYAQWKKLPAAAKAAVKASLTGRGAYKPKKTLRRAAKPRSLKGMGAYVPEEYSDKDIAKTVGGRLTGWIWDKLFGNGAYAPVSFDVKNNSFMNDIVANGPPSMHSTGAQSFVLRHREYLGDVTTSGTAREFDLSSYDINPGQSELMPWGSQIANQFQQYKVKGAVFEFVSTCSDAIASSTDLALGTVIMATNYNSAESDFVNKQQMLQTEFCSQGKPSQCILHPIECKPSLTSVETLYTRSGAVPSGQDQRLFDLGKFQLATQGFQGTNVNIGELWFSYEIELLKPIQSNGTSVLLGDFYNATTGISTSNPFSTSPTLNAGSNLGSEINGNAIEFPSANPGDTYFVFWQVEGTSAACTGSLDSDQCRYLKIWQGGVNLSAGAPSTGVSATFMNVACIVVINATLNSSLPPSLILNLTGMPTSCTSMDLCIAKITPNLVAGLGAILTKSKLEEIEVGFVEEEKPVSFRPAPQNNQVVSNQRSQQSTPIRK